MTTQVWRIGQLLNSVQSTFVGLLRVWSIPIVLLLSIASGYTTYYGMSFFITWWIALIITVAVQSIIVICTLELAGTHWKANLPRYLSIACSLVVALVVSISFSYFKFFEFSQGDQILVEKAALLQADISRYLDEIGRQKGKLVAEQESRTEAATREATQAYLGNHPAMQGTYRNQVGKGKFWSLYNEIQEKEEAKLGRLREDLQALDRSVLELRAAGQTFALHVKDAATYETMLAALRKVQGQAESLAAGAGLTPLQAPIPAPFAEFSEGVTPSFAMWKDISWFALACATMVDFFTLVLSYRLESTAPGPLTDEEKELAYHGLRQFSEFSINQNDELEFQIEKTELERARRYSDWTRMFAVAFLLNRGYLRKISNKSVEFAPNLYPIISDRLKPKPEPQEAPAPANDDKIREQMEARRYG
jgi:hypothetical protein